MDNRAAEEKTMSVPSDMKPFVEGANRLYSSGIYTDLVVTCNGHEWKVHKFCLCAHSDFFQSTCGGEFKEAKESKVDLKDDDPQAVEGLIHYCYNFDYPDHINGQAGVSPLVLDIRVFAIADKYFVEPLKQLAIKKFETRVKTEWDTAAFADAAGEVYQSTAQGPNPLKSIVVSTVKEHSTGLLDESKQDSQFLKILSTTTAFGADVSIALAKPSDTSTKLFKCPSCACVFHCESRLGKRFTCPNSCYGFHDEQWWSSDYHFDTSSAIHSG